MNTGRNISLTESLNRFVDVEEEARIEALRRIAAQGREAITRGDYVTLRTSADISDLIQNLSAEAEQGAAEGRATGRRG